MREAVERLRRRMVRALLAAQARDHPGRGQHLVGDLRRTVRAAPAHEAGLVLPEVVRPGEDPAVLHPDDLLVHEGAGLLPAGLQHRLAARGVPAVPGGILGDRLGDGRGDEAVVELGALAAVVPGHAVARRPVLVAGRMVRAVVVDEVRRIGREQHRPLAVHQPAHVRGAGAVAAEQPVVAEDPEIARARRRVARRLGHHDRRRRSAPPTPRRRRRRRRAAGRARRRRSRRATGRSRRPPAPAARPASSASSQAPSSVSLLSARR